MGALCAFTLEKQNQLSCGGGRGWVGGWPNNTHVCLIIKGTVATDFSRFSVTDKFAEKKESSNTDPLLFGRSSHPDNDSTKGSHPPLLFDFEKQISYKLRSTVRN